MLQNRLNMNEEKCKEEEKKDPLRNVDDSIFRKTPLASSLKSGIQLTRACKWRKASERHDTTAYNFNNKI